MEGHMKKVKRVIMDKGLGDSIHRFTKATGIKSAVDRMSQALDKPCNCNQRRETLNKMFPYKNK